jgi:hypothetical protein
MIIHSFVAFMAPARLFRNVRVSGCPALRPLGIGPGPGVGQVVAGVQVSAWSVPSTYQSAGPLGDCGADSNKSML